MLQHELVEIAGQQALPQATIRRQAGSYKGSCILSLELACKRIVPSSRPHLRKLCKTPSSRGAAFSREALAPWRDVAIHKPLIYQRFLDCHACVIARSEATWQSQ